MISEEQESITSSPQSVPDTSSDEKFEDSQLDKTMNDNPDKTPDTVLSNGKDLKLVSYLCQSSWQCTNCLFLIPKSRQLIKV